jgi:DNA repair protein RecN (Recombination protein N)
MPTLVFDEIDTGVSGSTADKMGSLVCSMGEKMQVIAITHLPQVAAKGNAHFLVSRKADVTSMRLLDSEGRVMEIARMLSGASITPAAIENARTLLG